MATSNRRGFYSSFQYVTLIGGQLIALGVQLVLQKLLLTDQQLHDWGWRIPFFIGAALAVVAFYIRAHLDESASFTMKDKAERGSLGKLLKYPKSVATVIGLTLGGTIAFYTYSIYMQKFLVNTVHLSIDQSTLISFFSLLLFALLQPVFGSLSDKVGRKPLLIGFGVLGTLCTVPLLSAIGSVSGSGGAFVLVMLGLLIVSGYTSINAVVKAELFPAEIRALGVGLPYALTTAIFGGTAEVVALWFKQKGQETWFYWYVTACIFISLMVYVTMRDTKKHSKITQIWPGDGYNKATNFSVPRDDI